MAVLKRNLGIKVLALVAGLSFPPSAHAANLLEGWWRVAQIGDYRVPAELAPSGSVTVRGSKIWGRAFCNYFWGKVTEGPSPSIKIEGITTMACRSVGPARGPMVLEKEMLTALADIASVKATPQRARLVSRAGTELELVRAPETDRIADLAEQFRAHPGEHVLNDPQWAEVPSDRELSAALNDQGLPTGDIQVACSADASGGLTECRVIFPAVELGAHPALLRALQRYRLTKADTRLVGRPRSSVLVEFSVPTGR